MRSGYVTQKDTPEATGGAIRVYSTDNLTLAPAAMGSGCEAHTVPPL
jgi:hypothetical protein